MVRKFIIAFGVLVLIASISLVGISILQGNITLAVANTFSFVSMVINLAIIITLDD